MLYCHFSVQLVLLLDLCGLTFLEPGTFVVSSVKYLSFGLSCRYWTNIKFLMKLEQEVLQFLEVYQKV